VTLPGPSRTIIVEPVEEPARPEPERLPEPVPVEPAEGEPEPKRQPAPAKPERKPERAPA
jgi:hypothetical protein